MIEPIRWKVTLTVDDLPRIREQVEWTLQRQNLRMAKSSPAARIGVHARQIVVVVACVLGLGALRVLWSVAPAEAHAHAILFVMGAAFFLIMLLVNILLPRARVRSRSFAGRVIAVTTRRLFSRMAAELPYEIVYDLQGATLVARIEKLNLTRRLELGAMKLALRAPGVVVLFRRKLAQRPTRVIYLDTGAGAALVEALSRVGVACEAIEGPSEGYADPGPVAA